MTVGRGVPQPAPDDAPLPDEVMRKAEEVVRRYGRRAAQHLVDRMQAALRAGDEEAAREADRVLRGVQATTRRLADECADAIAAQLHAEA